MPERYKEHRGPYAFTLAEAYRQGRIVRARCGHCRIKRHYDPGDLKLLVGDLAERALERKLRCDGCGTAEFMSVEFWIPTGAEWDGLIIRRLVGTKMIRKVFWRDEPARR